MKHGMRNSPEYKVWLRIHQRCGNPNHNSFHNYGGRGITVCERWSTFEAFFADMGQKPSLAHSLDRKNNDGPYSPDNCRWATRRQQDCNKTTNHILELNGRRQTICEWADELGIDANVISHRIYRGWTTERALTIPPRPRQKHMTPIKVMRLKRNITQETLAKRAGVNRACVMKIEAGVTKLPHVDTTRALSRVLGVSEAEFVSAVMNDKAVS